MRYPGVRYSFVGEQQEQRESLGGLFRGFVIALIVIYGLLAIPFRSYVQPMIVMSAIPFGLIGAAWGHVLMGKSMTILSAFGLVALTGVVVNDSLVLVDFINRSYRSGIPLLQAQFLIPMAISLAFGILFSTFIVLLVVPALYHILEDIRGALGMTKDLVPPALELEEPEPAS